jgi:tetratricopeptide (TPR) repeat protein
MFEFLKSAQLSRAGSFATLRHPSGAARREPWTLDRDWHRAEAERHLKAHNYAEAVRHLAIAVEDADRHKAPAKRRIRLRLELADTQRRIAPTLATGTDLLAAAETTARAAIAIAAETSDREEYVNCLDALADIFTDKRDYTSLETVEQEAIRLGAMLSHPDPLRMAKRVHRLAVARHKNGATEAAIPALEKSIQLHEASWGPNSREMAALLFEVGCIYRAQSEHPRAQECLRRALQLQEREFGPGSNEALVVLQQLAGSFEDAGDVDQAAAQYERCLMLKLRQVGVRHIDEIALMQYSLANLHAGWGNLGRARELLTDCIGAFRRDGGPRLAVTHEMLAQIEERSGRFHSAVKELELAGKVWDACSPPRHAELVRNLTYRADILDQLRKGKEASSLRERAASLESAAPLQALRA